MLGKAKMPWQEQVPNLPVILISVTYAAIKHIPLCPADLFNQLLVNRAVGIVDCGNADENCRYLWYRVGSMEFRLLRTSNQWKKRKG